MKTLRDETIKVGEQVYVVPIDECGEVTKIRRDSTGAAIYDVALDSDGANHVCRKCELETRSQLRHTPARRNSSTSVAIYGVLNVWNSC